MSYLIAFSLLCFFIVGLLKKEWGIYLVILLLPSYQIRFSLGPIPMTFLESMILLCALATILPSPLAGEGGPVLWRVRGRLFDVIRRDKLTLIFIALFLLAALISVFTSPVPIKAAGIFKAYFLEAVLFFFLLIAIIDDQKKLGNVFKAISALVLYLSVFGIYQFFTLTNLPFTWWGVEIASRRITSVLNHPNALALLLGPLLGMLIFKSAKSRLDWLSVSTGLIVFYLTFSRAGWLALIMTITIFGFLKFKKYNSPSPPLKIRGGWEGLLLSLAIIILILTIPFSRHKLLDLASFRDPTQQNRYVLWSAAFDILKKHPLEGSGLMGFHEAYKNYPLGPDRVVQNYPHNFFLNFWLETGFLGLISMIALLILFYRKIYKTLTSPISPPHEKGSTPTSPPREGEIERGLRNYALAAAAGMAMIVLHSLVDVSYFKNDLSVLFWLIYSLPFLNFVERTAL